MVRPVSKRLPFSTVNSAQSGASSQEDSHFLMLRGPDRPPIVLQVGYPSYSCLSGGSLDDPCSTGSGSAR